MMPQASPNGHVAFASVSAPAGTCGAASFQLTRGRWIGFTIHGPVIRHA